MTNANLASSNQNKSEYVHYKDLSSDQLSFDLDIKNENFIVLRDFFQNGWSVFANGQRVDIFPANYLFIGFRLPAGQYKIETRFSPPGYPLGLIGSGLAAMLLVICMSSSASPRSPF